MATPAHASALCRHKVTHGPSAALLWARCVLQAICPAHKQRHGTAHCHCCMARLHACMEPQQLLLFACCCCVPVMLLLPPPQGTCGSCQQWTAGGGSRTCRKRGQPTEPPPTGLRIQLHTLQLKTAAAVQVSAHPPGDVNACCITGLQHCGALRDVDWLIVHEHLDCVRLGRCLLQSAGTSREAPHCAQAAAQQQGRLPDAAEHLYCAECSDQGAR